MERRSFLAALAAILVAPKVLLRIAPPLDYKEMSLGLIDIMESTSLDGLSSNAYARWNT